MAEPDLSLRDALHDPGLSHWIRGLVQQYKEKVKMLETEKAALEIDATMWKEKKSEVESLAQLFDAAKKKLDAEESFKAEELTKTKVELQLALLQVGHLQNELEREKKRSQEERQNSEHRIKELQAQVEKLKLGRVTQQAVDEEKCLASVVTSREEVQKRKCTELNVGSVKKVRFAVEYDLHVQELGVGSLSEHLFRPDPNEAMVECPSGSENPIKGYIPQEDITEGNFIQHISTEVTNLDDSDDNILVIDLPDEGREVIAEGEGSNAGALQNKTTKDLEAADGGRVNVMQRLVSAKRDEASLPGEITSKFDQGSTIGREVEEGGDMKMTTWKLSKRCKQWAEERKQMGRCRVFCPMQNCKVTVNLAKLARTCTRCILLRSGGSFCDVQILKKVWNLCLFTAIFKTTGSAVWLAQAIGGPRHFFRLQHYLCLDTIA